MKIWFLIATLFLNHIMISAQDSWKIRWNKKIILTANKEDETGNTRKINLSDWNKNGTLDILYREAEPDTILWHSFLLFDEEDHQLMAKEKTLTAKISIPELRKLYTGKKTDKDLYYSLTPKSEYCS